MSQYEGPPQPPPWATPLLVAAAAVLVLVLGFVAWHTVTATAPLCNSRFPPRSTQYPVWLFVFSAIAAFGLGHVSSQVGIVRRRRPHLVPRREEEELGEGHWSKVRSVVAVNVAVAAFLYLVTALMVIEAVMLATGSWPITYYARCAADAGPLISLGGTVVYALVVGRWLWVFREHRR